MCMTENICTGDCCLQRFERKSHRMEVRPDSSFELACHKSSREFVSIHFVLDWIDLTPCDCITFISFLTRLEVALILRLLCPSLANCRSRQRMELSLLESQNIYQSPSHSSHSVNGLFVPSALRIHSSPTLSRHTG